MYDVVIIGAGPAGANLARMIDKKYKVLLVDKRELDKKPSNISFEKCCGGLLAPDAQYVLAKFGLGVPKKILTGPQLFTVKTIDFDNSIERYYGRHYINVNRDEFDRWLVEMIPSNVDFEFNCIYKTYSYEDGIYKIKLHRNNKDYSVSTKILVGADGAFSRVRKQISKNINYPKKYATIQEWYKTEQIMPFYTSIFDSSITDFYSWIIQKEEYLLLGSAIPIEEQSAYKKFNLLKTKLIDYGFQFNELYKKTGTLILRPNKTKQLFTGENKIALIGEAAGFISPSSAEGISYALKSSSFLANSINNNPENFINLYSKQTSKLKRNIILKNLKSPFMYNKTLRKIIMKSGIQSMEITKQ